MNKITCGHNLSGTVTRSNGVKEDWDLEIEIVYTRSQDGEVEIWEVLDIFGDPILEELYEQHEEDIIDAASEHAFSEAGEAQYFGNLSDYAYDRRHDH